jgi:hypothetical protein
MPEIGTSGSMSGDGKRSVAEWPKLPRPSSTLPFRTWRPPRLTSAFGAKADLVNPMIGAECGAAACSRNERLWNGNRSEGL